MTGNSDLSLDDVLDVSGFTQRFPSAVIQWRMSQLTDGERLTLVLCPDHAEGLTQELLARPDIALLSRQPVDGKIELQLQRLKQEGSLVELDMRGRRCPAPVVEAQRQLRAMASGDRLRLLSDCTGAPMEMDAWASHASNVAWLGQWRSARGHVFLLGRV